MLESDRKEKGVASPYGNFQVRCLTVSELGKDGCFEPRLRLLQICRFMAFGK
jgi:hypothetical protein